VRPGLQPQPCGGNCRSRLDLLQRMGGCRLLDRLCHRFAYSEVGEGFCLVDGTAGALALAPAIRAGANETVSESCCQWACDTRVGCAGFARETSNQTCLLISPQAPPRIELRELTEEEAHEYEAIFNPEGEDHNAEGKGEDQGNGDSEGKVDGKGSGQAAPHKKAAHKIVDAVDPTSCEGLSWAPPVAAWPILTPLRISGSDKQAGVMCYRKSTPLFIHGFLQISTMIGLLSFCSCAVLFVATTCGCCLQYTLVTRRKGSKGAGALVSKMMCPCLVVRSTRNRKFGHSLIDDDEEEEEEEDNEEEDASE